MGDYGPLTDSLAFTRRQAQGEPRRFTLRQAQGERRQWLAFSLVRGSSCPFVPSVSNSAGRTDTPTGPLVPQLPPEFSVTPQMFSDYSPALTLTLPQHA